MQSSAPPRNKPLKSREQRRVVFLKAEIFAEAGRQPGTICNIALHGLMVKCTDPPARGTFIEVRCGSVIVVGQVVWSQGMRFGLRSQDAIDLGALHASRSLGPKLTGERTRAQRSSAQANSRASALTIAERSRQTARWMDWLFVVAAASSAAFVLGSVIYSAMNDPIAQVHAALAPRSR